MTEKTLPSVEADCYNSAEKIPNVALSKEEVLNHSENFWAPYEPFEYGSRNRAEVCESPDSGESFSGEQDKRKELLAKDRRQKGGEEEWVHNFLSREAEKCPSIYFNDEPEMFNKKANFMYNEVSCQLKSAWYNK